MSSYLVESENVHLFSENRSSHVWSFSACDIRRWHTILRSGRLRCLFNRPLQVNHHILYFIYNLQGDRLQRCGNGQLDEDEDCDCGHRDHCTDMCCDPLTCKFKAHAKCSSRDPCCSQCRVSLFYTISFSFIKSFSHSPIRSFVDRLARRAMLPKHVMAKVVDVHPMIIRWMALDVRLKAFVGMATALMSMHSVVRFGDRRQCAPIRTVFNDSIRSALNTDTVVEMAMDRCGVAILSKRIFILCNSSIGMLRL